MSDVQDASRKYAKIIALMCARRVSNIAFLSIDVAINDLMFKILDQVNTNQSSL